MYFARQLSFKGVSFKVETVGLTPIINTCDECVQFWVHLLESINLALVNADPFPNGSLTTSQFIFKDDSSNRATFSHAIAVSNSIAGWGS